MVQGRARKPAARRCGLVSFFLNGRRTVIDSPPADLLLIDYLRSRERALSGPKRPCAEGGCGGCAVILSRWDEASGSPVHRAVNACLRPVATLEGLAVTTIEGTGSVHRADAGHLAHALTTSRASSTLATPTELVVVSRAQSAAVARRAATVRRAAEAAAALNGAQGGLNVRLREHMPDAPSERSHGGMNPVAWRLAENNGTQCGYCSAGIVMTMSEFLANHPRPTKREIEAALDGNLCRCTGYQSILTGMKTFAVDWNPADEAARMKCLLDPEAEAQRPTLDLVIPFPRQARSADQRNPRSGAWRSPTSLEALAALLRAEGDEPVRMVAGNTSHGVYKHEFDDAQVLVDLQLVAELHAPPEVGAERLSLPAGITFTDLIDLLDRVLAERGEREPPPELDDSRSGAMSRLAAVRHMAQRTAGRLVRNSATLAGNLMMVLHHLAPGTGPAFPSDIFTALVAAGAEARFLDLGEPGLQARTASLEDLTAACLEEPARVTRLVLIGVDLPYGATGELLFPHKVALREVNAHSIVNHVTRLVVDDESVVREASVVFGGIAPFPWRAKRLEGALIGRLLSLDGVTELLSALEDEVSAEFIRWRAKTAETAWEGLREDYRKALCTAFAYKTVVGALEARGVALPATVRSSAELTWGRWPVTAGVQSYATQRFEGAPWKTPVSEPYVRVMGMEQASGQVRYAHELEMPARSVDASMVQSRRALARWWFQKPGGRRPVPLEVLRPELRSLFDEFVDLIALENIPPGGINAQGMGLDQPVFAPFERVDYVGQALAVVAAQTKSAAVKIAAFVSDHCVGYADLSPKPGEPKWWSRPVLGLEDAIRLGSIYPDWPKQAPHMSHFWRVTRPGSRFSWVLEGRDPLERATTTTERVVDGAPCRVVESSQAVGGQLHFYMETQAAVAQPLDGRRMLLRPSTQAPMEMHQSAAMALGAHHNSIEVSPPPVGGAFGGKTEQARFVTAAAAVAAHAMKRAVRLTLTRDQDSAMIGGRHAFHAQYQVAIDTGDSDPSDRGLIHGFFGRMWGDGGAFLDCSFIVANCVQTRLDDAYNIRNFENRLDICRTNKAPSTAFRSMGQVQAKIILESAIDDAAFAIGMPAEEVRARNLYEKGEVTPLGQALPDVYLKEVWSFLEARCRYSEKAASVAAFNRENRWRKRGIAMAPLKYGSGYNLAMLEQAAATISIYQADGSVVIHQGGVEMGQGLITQVRQIAAYMLGLPLDMIVVQQAHTGIIPNPTSTGGSTGTSYNGEAVKRLCSQMKARLTQFANDLLAEKGPAWCHEAGIDFWNHPKHGWRTKVKTSSGRGMMWQKLVAAAYEHRIPLTATLNVPTWGGSDNMIGLGFRPADQQPRLASYETAGDFGGQSLTFAGFTYSAACSVVEVDVLTGETKVLSSDIAYDMGWSLNPAIDVGQVEGGFVQGIGYVLSEALAYEPEGPDAGRLNTTNTWTYKPPSMCSIPLELNTYLFPRQLAGVAGGPEEGVLSSKEVGEPPLVLASTVFLAVKSAIRASRLERGLPGLFRLDCPATVQEVRRACEVSCDDLGAMPTEHSRVSRPVGA